MAATEPLYLGLDLSTQQLKAVIISPSLHVVSEAKVDFDADFGSKYGIKKGVLVNTAQREVYAPVAMWLEAIDLVFSRLKDQKAPLERIKGVSGAGQQHGSVYWSNEAETLLAGLGDESTLVEQLSPKAFAFEFSPNWQDASTQNECDEFDAVLGSEDKLASITGSKAHHRFTGPQILKMRKKHPKRYEQTGRISLVSSFLASTLLGKIAPLDISDVCGMNLRDIDTGTWNDSLLNLASGEDDPSDLRQKLGEVPEDGGASFGGISDYFVKRYGVSPHCQVIAFTGDNPSTILSLPLRPMDAMVSLGTSTTFLMSTPKYVPDPAYHFMNHPTTAGLYMFMLCYKNGGLAREKIRDALPQRDSSDLWAAFNETATSTSPLGKSSSSDPAKLGLYFPLPEIVPNVRAGTWRYDVVDDKLEEATDWQLPEADARAIVESQVLSLRLRSRNLVESPGAGIPPQPRRVYLVGGGSLNPAIAEIVGEVLGGVEGVYKLDVGGNACALGGAYKAVWALEREKGESFEDLIAARWKEEGFIQKVDKGYRPDVWKLYEDVLPAFAEMEKIVLKGEEINEN